MRPFIKAITGIALLVWILKKVFTGKGAISTLIRAAITIPVAIVAMSYMYGAGYIG